LLCLVEEIVNKMGKM